MMKWLFILNLFIHSNFLYAQTVNIGVLAYNGKAEAIARWQPTADYLSQNISESEFKILPLTHEEFDHAINKKSLDFILTNPGHFVLLEVEQNINTIATLVSRFEHQTLNQFSAVLITRHDSDVKSVEDLSGKTLAAVNEEAFGGYQLAQNELLNYGIDTNKDMDVLWLGFPHVDLVKAVLESKADVATVRSGVIEKMAKEGVLKLSDLRIIAEKKNETFPFFRSFEMYPEWPFAKLPNTDLELSKKVVTTLLNMPKDHPAATHARGAGWTIPLNYSSVHQVLKRLQAPPYLPRAFSLKDLWATYSLWMISVIVLLIVSTVLLIRFYKSNQQLSITKSELKASKLYLEQTVIDRTEELKNTNDDLKSEIAKHLEADAELNKGCEVIQNIYTAFIRDDLTRQQRINSVVEALRFYLDFELVMLSRISENGFDVCCVMPQNDLLEAPISKEMAEQVIKQNQPFNGDGSEGWKRYLACPIFLNGQLSYLLELASSTSYQIETPHDYSKLSHHILYLIAHWVGYEALSVLEEHKELEKHGDVKQRFVDLTKREKEIVTLLVKGESNKSMANILNVSVKTIEMHRANALRKINAKSSTELVQMAVISGLFV